MRAAKFLWIGIFMVGCAIGEKEMRSPETPNQTSKRTSIDEDIERAMLDPDAVNAFELQAIEKFNDLVAYIQVAADTTLNEMLRQEANDAIAKLLVTEGDQESIVLTPIELQKTKDQLFKEGKSMKEIVFSNPFRPLKKELFAGEITYLVSDGIVRRTLNVYLLRVKKKFGQEQHEVWEIKFGQIR